MIRNCKKAPERTCIATGEIGTPDTLLRFVLDYDGELVFDLYQKLPGRGAWLTPSRSALQQAIEKKAFTRAFKQQVKIENGLADHIEERLKAAAYELLPLCQKSGLLIGGFEKVKEALANEEIAALLMASDASENAKEKMFSARATHLLIDHFTREELGGAVGRDQAVQVALLQSGLAEKFLQKMQCFTGFHDKAAL